MLSNDRDDFLLSEINVTPFVDVMLVLLIIFMVTAPMMTQGVNVSLPEISSARPLPSEAKPVIVSVDSDGAAYINGRKTPPALFRRSLLRTVKDTGKREVFLKADRKVPYGAVARVISEIHEAGIVSLGIVALPSGRDAGKTDKGPARKK
ncbi:Biopolymer transport protein ExbD [Candidatus Desulfarcum epimagneticum]|uniref:Biopolymer transport protein ExbD n=1 Tax=uncultured Desulfobacteraceae bacterium TaxID=218296 RepID=A0A484HQT0_9BACT|nr:Biopolymer transport protein ExbD [uncultured Desulfobacteraceae bacterium]